MSPDTPLLFDDDEELDSAQPARPLSPLIPEYPLFEQFAKATLRKRQLAREVKATQAELDKLTPLLLAFFSANPEWRKAEVCGLNIHQRSQFYVGPLEGYTRQDVCDALRASGLGHYVQDSFSVRSLNSYVQDLEERHQDEFESGAITETSELLPPELAQVLNVEPKIIVVGLQVRKPRS